MAPRGDGTGPPQGGGGRRDRQALGGPRGGGAGGQCVCPMCGHRMPHVAGQPCQEQRCPKCETRMTRKQTSRNSLEGE